MQLDLEPEVVNIKSLSFVAAQVMLNLLILNLN